MKKRAFTLAEILISMAIIGVVAVLMVPVIQNSQLKALETNTAHFHSMMSQAFKHYMVDNDVETLSDTELFGNQGAVDDFMHRYLEVAKVCSKDKLTDCFSKTIRNLSGDTGEFDIVQENAYVLSNGNVLVFRVPDANHPGDLQFDVNGGKKGPNTAGRDIWNVSVYADGVISERLHQIAENYQGYPEGMNSQIKGTVKVRFRGCYGVGVYDLWEYGAGCFARFENNGFKFDY